jgi:hypothetical protein
VFPPGSRKVPDKGIYRIFFYCCWIPVKKVSAVPVKAVHTVSGEGAENILKDNFSYCISEKTVGLLDDNGRITIMNEV